MCTTGWHDESRLDTFAGEGCWEEWLPSCGATALDSSSCSGPDPSPVCSYSSCPGDPGKTPVAHASPPPTPPVLPPPLFSALSPPSLHFPCGIFFFPKSKEFLFIVSCEISVSQTKEARSYLRTLPLLFPLAGMPFPQIPIFYLSQGMWSFIFENVFF